MAKTEPILYGSSNDYQRWDKLEQPPESTESRHIIKILERCLLLKRDRKFKNVIAMLTLCAAVLAIDVTAPAVSENNQEARFLGIGTKKEYGSCTLGTRKVTKTFTIFLNNKSRIILV